MPIDYFRFPWGIQTDIIGAGGSSGSAIVDPCDGKIIGIAQRVLQAAIWGIYTGFSSDPDGTIKKKHGYVSGNANIGLVYGVAAYSFSKIPETVKRSRDAGTPLNFFNIASSGLHLQDGLYGQKEVPEK